MVQDLLLKEALKLSAEDRIRLAGQLWDSIAAEPVGPDLGDDQMAELDRRLDRLERTGPLGAPWEEVKARILSRGP